MADKKWRVFRVEVKTPSEIRDRVASYMCEGLAEQLNELGIKPGEVLPFNTVTGKDYTKLTFLAFTNMENLPVLTN